MTYKWVEGTGEGFDEVYALRHEVFVEEQGYSTEGEFDEQDAVCRHLIGYENGRAVCSARLIEDHPGQAHIGRMLVVKGHRGKGLGLVMMQKMVEEAKNAGAKTILLNAQADKTHFYERAGFALTGGESEEEGTPHKEMKMEL